MIEMSGFIFLCIHFPEPKTKMYCNSSLNVPLGHSYNDLLHNVSYFIYSFSRMMAAIQTVGEVILTK